MKFKIWASIERENDAGEVVDVNPDGMPVGLGVHPTWKKALEWLDDHLPEGARSVRKERPIVMKEDPKPHRTFKIHEIDSIYVEDDDRFIVSLVVGYQPGREPVKTIKQAVRAALELTRDEGADGTHWHVYDRKTKRFVAVIQREIDP